MEVSKSSVKGGVINGSGKNVRARQALEWMQTHPFLCKKTNIKNIGNCLAREYGGTCSSFIQVVNRLLRKGLVKRSNGKRRADFRINYFHPEVPADIIKSAPEEDKRFISDVYDRADKMCGKVDNEGAIETTIEKPAPIEEPTIIEEPVATPAQAEEPVVEQTLPVEVKQTKQGTQITFTIDISL